MRRKRRRPLPKSSRKTSTRRRRRTPPSSAISRRNIRRIRDPRSRAAISATSAAAPWSSRSRMRCSPPRQGDLLAPVLSDFGWHVIKVTGVRPARTQPFEEVRAQIEGELKKQKAAQKFATAADQFQNLVYEQADSLAGTGKALDLKVETTGFVTRAQAQALGLGECQIRRDGVLAGVGVEQAQHRGDRSRAQLADRRAHHRAQARCRRGHSPRSRTRSASSSSARPRASSRRRPASRSSRCCRRARATRKRDSRSASRRWWGAASSRPDFRPKC